MSWAENQAAERLPMEQMQMSAPKKKKKSMLRKHLAPGGPITELIFPGTLFFSFHSPCYAANVTRHRGLDLGLSTQSELCPFSPFTSCLTVGLLLHLFEPHL